MRDKELTMEVWDRNTDNSDDGCKLLFDETWMLIGFDNNSTDKPPTLLYYRGKAYKITPLEDDNHAE